MVKADKPVCSLNLTKTATKGFDEFRLQVRQPCDAGHVAAQSECLAAGQGRTGAGFAERPGVAVRGARAAEMVAGAGRRRPDRAAAKIAKPKPRHHRRERSGYRAGARFGRRTALIFPLFPPPQNKRSPPSDFKPGDASRRRGMSSSSSTSPVCGSSRRKSLCSPSQVACQSSPSTQVTPVTKRLDSMVRRIAPVSRIDLMDFPRRDTARPTASPRPMPGPSRRRRRAPGWWRPHGRVCGSIFWMRSSAIWNSAGRRTPFRHARRHRSSAPSCRSPDRTRSACRPMQTRHADRRRSRRPPG